MVDPPRILRVPRAINRLTSPNTAPARVLRAHKWLYERSGGRVGHGMIGAPTLLLVTVGRKSGATRATPLVYARDGERFVVAGSNDGLDRDPAWVHNVRARPAVELQIARERLGGTARFVERDDPAFDRLWAALNERNHGRFDHYQSMTRRPLPVVVIEPSAGRG